jgi:hypothetical protein
MSPRYVTGRHMAKNFGEASTEWNYTAIGGDNIFRK